MVLPAALLLAAALAGFLAAAVLLAAAIVRPEHAATRESRRERSGRERDLNRLSDDLLVHSAPLVSFLPLPFGAFLGRSPDQVRSPSRRRTL